MPEPDAVKSFDPTASEPSGRLEAARRSPAFRYAAIAICGIGLATAGSTFLRLSQGWRQPAQPSAPAPDAPSRAAPETMARTDLTPRPPPPAAPAPGRPPAQPSTDGAEAPAVAAAEPVAPEPSRETVGEVAQAPAARPDEAAAVPPAAGPASPELVRPVPGPSPMAPTETGRARAADPPRQGIGAGPSRERPQPDGKPRRRYADPPEPSRPSQFRAAAAPAGSAAGVRAYSFASGGGRVIDGAGTRVQVIRVR